MRNFLIRLMVSAVILAFWKFLIVNTWFTGVLAGITMSAFGQLTKNILETKCSVK